MIYMYYHIHVAMLTRCVLSALKCTKFKPPRSGNPITGVEEGGKERRENREEKGE